MSELELYRKEIDKLDRELAGLHIVDGVAAQAAPERTVVLRAAGQGAERQSQDEQEYLLHAKLCF